MRLHAPIYLLETMYYMGANASLCVINRLLMRLELRPYAFLTASLCIFSGLLMRFWLLLYAY